MILSSSAVAAPIVFGRFSLIMSFSAFTAPARLFVPFKFVIKKHKNWNPIFPTK